MVKPLRAAVKWWVFLPLVPILIAIVAEYSRALFHSMGFYRIEWAAYGLEILDAFALMPYMALDSEVLARFLGPLGDPTSFPSLILVMSLPAIACCILLYGVSLVVEIVFKKPSNKSLEPTAGRCTERLKEEL
jgi:hypothetical protein